VQDDLLDGIDGRHDEIALMHVQGDIPPSGHDRGIHCSLLIV
jgi:hypothetical protein